MGKLHIKTWLVFFQILLINRICGLRTTILTGQEPAGNEQQLSLQTRHELSISHNPHHSLESHPQPDSHFLTHLAHVGSEFETPGLHV